MAPYAGPWTGTFGGFVVWLIPFAVSCFFVGPDGEKTIDEDWFRVLMMVCGSASSVYAVGRCAPPTRRAGRTLALQFLFVNWALDLMVLVPLMASAGGATGTPGLTLDGYVATVPQWFKKIGASYIAFVTLCIAAGCAAEEATAVATVARVSKDR